jgi:hypothetical protein
MGGGFAGVKDNGMHPLSLSLSSVRSPDSLFGLPVQWEESETCPQLQCPEGVPVKRYARYLLLMLFATGALYHWLIARVPTAEQSP